MNALHYHIIFQGHVQGVGFRYTAQNIAKTYPLAGYVKNLPGGSVELAFEARVDHAKAFIKQILDQMQHHITAHDITTSSVSQKYGPIRTDNLQIAY